MSKKLKVTKNKQMIDNKVTDEERKVKRWAFPTAVRCPRCGALDTICRHTDNIKGRQYRKCQRAVCRYRFSIDGKLV